MTMSNTVSLAPSERSIGFQPVMEDSASRLSAQETTGKMPFVSTWRRNELIINQKCC